MPILGTRIKEMRRSFGWSQDALADKLGTTRSCIGNYEQGTRKPDYETLEQLAELFNVDASYLTGKQDTHRKYATKADFEKRSIDELFAMPKKGFGFDELSMNELDLLNNFRQLNDEGQHQLLQRSDELIRLGYTE